MRIAALVLILIGLAVLGYDGIVFLDRGEFPLTSLRDLWAMAHNDSLLQLEPAVARHLGAPLWDWVLSPLLQQSAAAVSIGLGLAILITRAYARRRARRREGFSFKRR